jgi:tight adherence protein C
MTLVLLAGIVLFGLAFALGSRALLLSRVRAATGLRGIDVYGLQPGAGLAPLEAPAAGGWRVAVDALASRVGAHVPGASPERLEALRQQLQAAGFYSTPPQRFLGYRVLGTAALGGFWMLLLASGGASGALGMLGFLLALYGGWALPRIAVRRRAASRARSIDRDLPELIDTLVTTVQAGIAFGASLQIASRRFRGPLGEELRLMLQEQSMGLGLNESLSNLVARQDVPAVRSFVRSILQGEQLGVSVTQTLRSLAQEMRARRRQHAEEQAQKAPVKMVFPLVLFMFPSLVLIVLGPAVLRLHDLFR